MQKEAELHAEEDKKAKESIEIRNNADSLAYQSEKQLKELGDKVPADKKKPIEDAIAALREALKGTDNDAIKSKYDDLQNKFQAVSEELYKQAAASAGAGSAGGAQQGGPQGGAGAEAGQGSGKKDDVVDAEFEVVDDDKKK